MLIHFLAQLHSACGPLVTEATDGSSQVMARTAAQMAMQVSMLLRGLAGCGGQLSKRPLCMTCPSPKAKSAWRQQVAMLYNKVTLVVLIGQW